MSEHHVIIGGGQAGGQAAQTLRQAAPAARITLLAAEPEPPYQRPPLSKKYLAGALPRERLLLRPQSFYAEKAIALEQGASAVEIDRAAQRVTLADGRTLPYDRLLLATGGRARALRVPGATLPGVHYLRTVADVDRIRAALDGRRRVVLIGAGYIGLEAAAVLITLGHDVTVLEAAERPLARVVCAEVARFYHDYHTQAGVRLVYGTAVTEILGGDRASEVVAADGQRYPCDLAIVGIGIEPNVELAAAAGLACDNGIVVDRCARTEDAAVFAAGDCANQPDLKGTQRVRLESVPNAVHQAKVAAQGMLGTPTPYAEVPWFWSDQYDLKLQIAGLSAGYEEVVLRGDPAAKSFAAYYLTGGRIVAVDAVNSPRDFLAAKKLIAAGVSIAPSVLADPATDLAALGG